MRSLDWTQGVEREALNATMKDGSVAVLRDQEGNPAFIDGKPAFNGKAGRKCVDNFLHRARHKAKAVVKEAKDEALPPRVALGLQMMQEGARILEEEGYEPTY